MPRKNENWLKAYMEFTRHLEAPDTFHFWAGVATVAGALRGKTWIEMGYWRWKPNFFIIFVAPPGVATKSTTIGVGVDLLRQIEGVHFGPDSATWQGITDAFMESTETISLDGEDPFQISCLTIAASELGTFLDPKNREMVDILVDLWDGRSVPWKRRTKGEGSSSIPNPWINFIGATTPAWLSENFPEYAIRGGFTSRSIFVFGKSKRHFVAYPSTRVTDGDLQLRHTLVADLQDIASLAGPFTLTSSAIEWGTQWYEEHWSKGAPDDDRLTGYISRKQTHVHKLAMILSACESSSLQITAEHLTLAVRMVEAIEGEMMASFDQVSDDPRVKQSQEVLKVLALYPDGITKKNLWRICIHRMGEWHFDNALTGAMNSGMIRAQLVPGDVLLTLHKPEEQDPRVKNSEKLNETG